MDNIISYLEQLELTPSEAKTYSTIAETGPITARDLAQRSGMHYTQVYRSLDVLFKKGLVVKMVKASQTHFALTEPKESLPALIVQKANDLQVIKEGLPAVLRTLRKTQSEEKETDDVEIKYYKGKAGVKKIYKEALEAKELRSYANLSEMEGVFPENLTLFSNAFQDNPQLKMYEIVEDSPASRQQTQLSSLNERYFYKFISNKVKLAPADTLIYDGKVSIINVKNEITGVVLSNPEYYNNTKELFDFIWGILPDPKR
jgi:sugar-specific transcriptional regulator TrmB